MINLVYLNLHSIKIDTIKCPWKKKCTFHGTIYGMWKMPKKKVQNMANEWNSSKDEKK